MKNEFTPELIEKAKTAASAAALLALAKENNVSLTAEEAGAYYAQLHPETGKLADEELDNVAGGGCHSRDGRLVVTDIYGCQYWSCNMCGMPLAAHVSREDYHTSDTSSFTATTYICANGVETRNKCGACGHCSYDGGLLHCNHPANRR